jgi:hypothetical protein
MSTDSEETIGLMEGIRELGLALDDDPPSARPLDSVKPERANPSVKRRPPAKAAPLKASRQPDAPPRRRRPRTSAPRLDLRDLLGDAPAPGEPEPSVDSGPGIEERIGEYFTARSRQIADSFRAEVTGMLRHTAGVDQIARAFVADLRTAVKQAIDFEVGTIDLTVVLSNAELAILGFREVISAGAVIVHASHQTDLMTVATARDLVRVRIASVREIIALDTERLDRAVSELEQIKLAKRKERAEREQRQSLFGSQFAEIEATAIGLKCAREVYERLRRKWTSPIDLMGFGINRDIRQIIEILKDWNAGEVSQSMRRKKLETAEQIQEIQELRAEWEREQSLYLHAIRALGPIGSLQQVQRGRKEDESTGSTRTELSIEELRSRLETMQMEQDKALESMSVFLDQVKANVPNRSGRRGRSLEEATPKSNGSS